MKKVVACHQALFMELADGTVWGLGHFGPPFYREYAQIEIPDDCKNIKKLAHGKFTRYILTESNDVYVLGKNKNY